MEEKHYDNEHLDIKSKSPDWFIYVENHVSDHIVEAKAELDNDINNDDFEKFNSTIDVLEMANKLYKK